MSPQAAHNDLQWRWNTSSAKGQTCNQVVPKEVNIPTKEYEQKTAVRDFPGIIYLTPFEDVR